MARASITTPRCTVCAHADRLTIEHTLACGGGQNATAERFGLSKDAIGRHWANHVSDTWKAAARMGPYGSREQLEKLCLDQGVSVVEGLKALYASHHAMLIATRETGATQPYLAVSREMRATLNDIGRITGELLPSVTTNVTFNQFNSVNYLMGLGEDLVSALADMPDALDRIHAVLKGRMATALPSPDVIEGMARAA